MDDVMISDEGRTHPLSTNSTSTDLTTPDTSGSTNWTSRLSPSSSMSSVANNDTITSINTVVTGPLTVEAVEEKLIPVEHTDTTTEPAELLLPIIPSISPLSEIETNQSLAEQLYSHGANFVNEDEYASWLGGEDEIQQGVREKYMDLFNFENKSILSALRVLCDKLYMKGESQQLNRVIEAFSNSWVNQNPNHGFGDSNVVYTITYALVLLNTDLYAADHTSTKKMSRSLFIQNTLETVRAQRTLPLERVSTSSYARKSEDNTKRLSVMSTTNVYDTLLLVQDSGSNLQPMSKEWEYQLESILRSFYSSVAKEPLKLHILENPPFSPLSRIYSPSGRHDHSPSIISATAAAIQSSGSSIFGRMNLGRLRNKHAEPHQSRLAGISDSSGGAGRTGETYRHDSLASSYSFETSLSSSYAVSRHAVGFAGLLWNSMIKEEGSETTTTTTTHSIADFSKIEKELADEVELELQGAPWAKEGILLYRPYVDPSTGKKPKKKDWTKIFMVVQRGQLKMFKFDLTSSSSSSSTGAAVGGGNWMENAQLVDGFHLCHTLAQELPPPKKHNGFAAVWSLTLPERGLLVFQAGTPEVAREFVYTCNYWAGRLSKEPFDDPVSNMEFGWNNVATTTDDDANDTDNEPSTTTNTIDTNKLTTSMSTPNLKRNSISTSSSNAKPGDRLTIKEWKPSGHNMVVSDLDEEKQLKSLQEYIKRAENDLQEHNELSPKISKLYTPSTTNWTKAHTNWSNKSQFLLQQVIRYKTYVEILDQALKDRRHKLI